MVASLFKSFDLSITDQAFKNVEGKSRPKHFLFMLVKKMLYNFYNPEILFTVFPHLFCEKAPITFKKRIQRF